MNQLKYVIVDNQFGTGTPIVFPESLPHSCFRRLFPTSAGFCRILDGEWICYGESESLRISSCENDSEVLNSLIPIN